MPNFHNWTPNNTLLKVKELKIGGIANHSEKEDNCIEVTWDRDETEQGLDVSTIDKLNKLFKVKSCPTIGKSKYNRGIKYGKIKIYF